MINSGVSDRCKVLKIEYGRIFLWIVDDSSLKNMAAYVFDWN